ncbi:MAG: insulinase family protein [Gammaproteobacteria bacterium]|nr:insulinase family protein [Gammaproteobacteria bacterium]
MVKVSPRGLLLGCRGVIAACILLVATSTQAYVATTVIKSPNDLREYESLVLDNNLKVLLISDPDTDKAAAAMDVYVGSSSDPEGREGLAHFLEHMLFLGTEKYPRSGEYQEYISSRGGSHNAYTAYEHTNYFFDVDANYLGSALDRFAQFFVTPLFSAEYVSRERNAVHSEYQAGMKDDSRRISDAQAQVGNPRYPGNRFSVGSLDTLPDGADGALRDELISFYERHYSAEAMALVVLGREPLPALRTLVVDMFSAIRERNGEPSIVTEPQFLEGQLPVLVKATPVKERRSLELSFPIPSLLPHYRSGPTSYISHLLGHEAQGSLLSLLKDKGWAEALSAGAGSNTKTDASFRVAITLTEEGLHHTSEIVLTVFQYLNLIKAEGIQSWIFEELSALSEVEFRFQEKSNPRRYVSGLARSLQIYPAEDVLRGPYLLEKFDAELIRNYLGELTPDNVVVSITAQNLYTDQSSPWYGTQFRATKIDPETISQWINAGLNAELQLPTPNEFLPEQLEIKASTDSKSIPVLLRRELGFGFWYQQDGVFRLPRAELYFSVRSAITNNSAANSVFTSLYVRTVNDQLSEFAYPALLAGLEYEIYKHIRGFTVKISGFDDKQEILLKRILKGLQNVEINPRKFLIFKEELRRSLRNTNQNRPYIQNMHEIRDLLLDPNWSDEERLAALAPLTAADLRDFIPKLYERIQVVALSHGNVSRTQAVQYAETLYRALFEHAEPEEVPSSRVARLAGEQVFVRELDIDHQDSAISIYTQGADRSFATRAKMALLGQILSASFFDELRTQKQLGYVVYSSAMNLLEVPGISFVIQSPTTDPVTLYNEIEEFLGSYDERLVQMDPETFQTHKDSLITRIREKEERMQVRSERYWVEIDRGHYNFDSREKLATKVESISKQEFEQFYRRLLLSKERNRLVVWNIGLRHAELAAEMPIDTVVIDSPTDFKQGADFFPSEVSPFPVGAELQQ